MDIFEVYYKQDKITSFYTKNEAIDYIIKQIMFHHQLPCGIFNSYDYLYKHIDFYLDYYDYSIVNIIR